MNRINRPSRLPLIGALALAVGLAACNKPEDSRTAGQKLDGAIAEAKQASNDAANATSEAVTDATIVTKVNAALMADDQLKALKINVDCTDGHVKLSGSAPDADSQSRAATLANAVDGVRSVDNQLVVNPKA